MTIQQHEALLLTAGTVMAEQLGMTYKIHLTQGADAICHLYAGSCPLLRIEVEYYERNECHTFRVTAGSNPEQLLVSDWHRKQHFSDAADAIYADERFFCHQEMAFSKVDFDPNVDMGKADAFVREMAWEISSSILDRLGVAVD